MGSCGLRLLLDRNKARDENPFILNGRDSEECCEESNDWPRQAEGREHRILLSLTRLSVLDFGWQFHSTFGYYDDDEAVDNPNPFWAGKDTTFSSVFLRT